jgi:transcription antitermination factor NusG
VDSELREKGLTSYLPLQTVMRRWSDRWKKIQEPLFRCYVFVRIPLKDRIRAVQTTGVVRMVCFNGTPSPIPDAEMNAVRRILDHDLPFEPAQFLAVGQTVEVIRGALEGIRGKLIQRRGQRRLLVGIEKIGQGISVEIAEMDVRLIADNANLKG